MVISPASLVTLSTERWQELGESLARRAETSTETSDTAASPNDRTDGEEPNDVHEH